ncbi:MAG: MATE family efflux transporter [Gammaproteobacteria bacterium AqS3]|nr:MATE family efflux transporter [Gammaproteobacteria bacterium AqS3]
MRQVDAPQPDPQTSAHPIGAGFVDALRDELKVFGRLSGPMLISQMSQMLMGTIDVVMAGRLSALDLAAVALGSSVLWPVFFLLVGPVLALGPVCAQLHGAKRYQKAGYTTRQGLMLAGVISLIGFLVLYNSHLLLGLFGVPEDTLAITADYLRAVSWSAWGLTFFTALRNYSEAANLTIPVSVLAASIALLNIPANYVFMYGKLGFPAMGAVGCGVATSLLCALLALIMLIIVVRLRYYKPHRLFRSWQRPDLSVMRELCQIGLPMGLSIFIEITIFSGAAILISTLGETVVAGHQIALNFAGITFMLPLAVGLGATVRIGNLIGAGQPLRAVFAARVAIGITMLIALMNFSVLYFLAEEIVALYGPPEAVAAIAVVLFVYAAAFQIPDGLQVCYVCILRGHKITMFTLWTMMVGYWFIGLPVGWILGMSDWWGPAQGAEGMWKGMIAGLIAVFLMLAVRLRMQTRRLLAAG